jgi:Zn-dependent peptidase ImmA (M78 family)/DNA-binding XRE family transcriptional regulator
MSELFGQRLKAARKMAGLSQEALAREIGDLVTKQAISKYEKGSMKPNSQILIAMAKALDVSPGYFYKESNVALANLEFRKKAKLSQKERNQIENKAIDFLERYLEIEGTLGEEVFFNNPLQGFKIKSYDDVESAAQRLRRSWNLGDKPISKLTELIEGKGIRIYEIKADDQFDGLSASVNSIKVIILNSNSNLDRRRFTLAHELGHIMLDFPNIIDGDKEKLCHAFAGAFLLPKDVVRSELGKSRSRISLFELKRLKGIYGISMLAIVYRAHKLGIISDNAYKGFYIYAGKRGWRKAIPGEPGDYVGKEKANRFEQLVFRGVAENIISMSKGAELMNVKLAKFRKDLQILL